jgi:hypothetical protein
MYRQWKEQPRIVSMVQRPQHTQQAEREKLSDVLKELTHTIDQRGHVTYSLDNHHLFRDEGHSIAVLDTTSQRAIAAALATAHVKFGHAITLVGSDHFKQQAVAAAVKNNLSVRFTEPNLNQLREQLFVQKMQVERQHAQRLMTERVLEKRSTEKTKQPDAVKERGRGRGRDDGPGFSR